MTEIPIELHGASRWYGQVLGVNDVSCAIEGGITALLGPNGAGKSTLIKLITGQLRPTTGAVKVFGQTPFGNPAVYRRLGYVPETEACYDEMTGREFVTMMAGLAGQSGSTLATRTTEMIHRVGMEANADRKIGGYSKGMRQRIKLAQSLVHDPDLLVLDEPLNGLDPMGRRDITRLVRQFAEEGKSVLISSHILYEVEQTTQNILLMNHGRLLARGDISMIRALIDRHPHRVAIETNEPRRLAASLLELSHVVGIQFDNARPDWLEIETRSAESFYREFPEIILDQGHLLRSFESPDDNLEAVFRYLVNG